MRTSLKKAFEYWFKPGSMEEPPDEVVATVARPRAGRAQR